MLFITNENELSFDGLQAFYFYAPWVPFHKKMLIMIDKIEKKHKINFTAIDTDQFKEQCRRFDINVLPTTIIYNNGKEINRINGIVLTSAFKAFFNDIYNDMEKL